MTGNPEVNVLPVPRPDSSLPLEPDSFRYAAFISYRHVQPDRTWAEWLHTALETYRVPRNLRPGGFPPRLASISTEPSRPNNSRHACGQSAVLSLGRPALH